MLAIRDFGREVYKFNSQRKFNFTVSLLFLFFFFSFLQKIIASCVLEPLQLSDSW